MYSYFRQIRSVGIVRAWYAAQADRRDWDDERYPLPPRLRRPDPHLFEGSWADLSRSYRRVKRAKAMRLRRRREARKYRVYQRENR